MSRAAAMMVAFVMAFAGVVAVPGAATAWEYGDTAFEVHLMGEGETGFFVKWWPAPAATPIEVTFEDPATPKTPDYQTEFVAELGDEGYGGGSNVPYEAKAGDVVTLTDGTTTKSHTVLAVRVTSVDVGTDRVHGTAAPNSEGYVWSEVARDFTASASGSWMVDFSVAGPNETPLDIVAGTEGAAEQFDADGDSTVYDWQVPRPEGWQRNPANGHDYLYVNADMSWTEAEAHAVSLGGHLVTINSAAEDAWLTATLGTGYGIGLNDRAVEGAWKWASGEPVTYTNWLPGEPNNAGTGEDAVVTWNQPPIGWNDVPGDGMGSFVVEVVRPVPFTDIAGSIFKPDIEWVYLVGITSGCTATLYCPEGYVTREQMASFLARALHLSGTAPDAFSDDESSIHEPNINLVAAAGIASGCAPGKFCPTGLVSREQMASFLARALHLSGAAPDAFTDDETSIHEPNINLVAREGIASGCGSNKYCPLANVTRGQMAAFLHRAFGP